MDLTNEDVADILALLDSLPYDEFDLRTDRFHLTLRRGSSGGWTEESELLTQPTTVTPATVTPGTREAGGAGRAAEPSAASKPGEATAAAGALEPAGAPAGTEGAAPGDGDGLVAVVAPLPGTFYRAPRPGAPPFVEIGDSVGADTVVAIVETMKLMNSVHAGAPGRVARICLENGEFAQLGTTLLLIEPDS